MTATHTPPPAGAPNLRRDLYQAAINCAHSIDADKIVLHRDTKLPGNALSQLGDRLAAVAPQSVSVPDGMALVPHYRGYARLGTGQYLMNHSAAGENASFVISVATDAEKAGRVVGDERENTPGNLLQPEVMAIRIDFTSAAGLDAMENQLRKLRAEHFPAAPLPQPQADTVVKDLAMLVRRLARALAKVDPSKALPHQAVDYLQRKGLKGSLLRDEPDLPQQGEGSIDSPEFWNVMFDDSGNWKSLVAYIDAWHSARLARTAAPSEEWELSKCGMYKFHKGLVFPNAMTNAPRDADMLREIIRIVREYPDFDDETLPFSKMMDQALAGKTPELLVSIEHLAQGRMPPAPAPLEGQAIPTDLSKLVRYDAVAAQNNGYDWGVEMVSADAGRFVEFDDVLALAKKGQP